MLTAQKIDTEKLQEVFIIVQHADSYYKNKIRNAYQKEMHDYRGLFEASYKKETLLNRLEEFASEYNDNTLYYDEDVFKEQGMETPDWYDSPGYYDDAGNCRYEKGTDYFEDNHIYYDILTAAEEFENLDDPDKIETFLSLLESETGQEFIEKLDEDE